MKKQDRIRELKNYLNELATAKKPIDPYYKRIVNECYQNTFLKIKQLSE